MAWFISINLRCYVFDAVRFVSNISTKKGLRKYFIKLTYYEFKWLSISQIPRETVNQLNRFNSIWFLAQYQLIYFSPFITFFKAVSFS